MAGNKEKFIFTRLPESDFVLKRQETVISHENINQFDLIRNQPREF